MGEAIRIHDLYTDGGDGFMVYAKGHVDKRAFRDQFAKGYGDCKVEDIRHVYARFRPVTGKDYDMEFCIAEGPGPGAFKATFLEGE